MKAKIFTAVFLSAMCGSALAQTPTIDTTWGSGVGTKPVYVYALMPSACDNVTLYALQPWNNAGASFAFGWPTNPISSTRISAQTTTQNRATIQVEDGSLSNPSALMAAVVSRLNYEIVNADIYVNKNLLFYGDGSTGAFHCPAGTGTAVPSDKYDFQSAMLHELGHTLGFQLAGEYYGSTSCVMYASLGTGVSRRQLCFGEYNEFRSAYGIR